MTGNAADPVALAERRAYWRETVARLTKMLGATILLFFAFIGVTVLLPYRIIDLQLRAAVSYAESGRVIGQTVEQLDRRYREKEESPPGITQKSYLVGVVDIDTAYYMNVTFDPVSRQAIQAELRYDCRGDGDWTKPITAPAKR